MELGQETKIRLIPQHIVSTHQLLPMDCTTCISSCHGNLAPINYIYVYTPYIHVYMSKVHVSLLSNTSDVIGTVLIQRPVF